MARRRRAWRRWQPRADPARLVFIDETWAKTNMQRLRGRAPRGERVVGVVPHGHWKTTTLIAALDLSGVRCSTLVDGAVNADVFSSFCAQVLCPQLRAGDLVVMDNLSSHKGQQVRTLVEGVGARPVFLPPYSPDLNPIELAFSKLKQLWRSLAARTVDLLWSSTQGLLDKITAGDAAGFFRHCGYTLQMN